MSYFAVIDVGIDFVGGYADGAFCIAVFPEEQAAYDLIAKMQKEQSDSYRQRNRYIEGFVDGIEVPKTDYNGWIEFLKKYEWHGRYTTPQNFKKEMKYHLGQHMVKIEGYNPPAVINGRDNLFVVKVDLPKS
jgi:hypothetical protein